MRQYTAVLIRETYGYTVLVPALPGCFTQGATVEEALANAKEAISLHLESLQAQGEPIPEEAEPLQLARVAV